MNAFIRQFGRPSGRMGKLFGRMMAVSNKKMHKAVLPQIKGCGCLLEIGFGSGAQLEIIHKAQPKTRLYGIDVSDKMLEMARKKLDEKAQLSLCDCAKTPFENSCFDAVISTDCCYFWHDAEKVLREIKRITKPSGKLVLAYNQMYAKSVHKADNSLGMYCDENIINSCAAVGLKLISNKKCGRRQRVLTFVSESVPTDNGEKK